MIKPRAEARGSLATHAPRSCQFIDLEDRVGAEVLREAIEQRRYGKRTLEFNCFDVVIDAEVGTVSIADAIALDGLRAVIPITEVLDALRRLPKRLGLLSSPRLSDRVTSSGLRERRLASPQ